MGRVGPPGVSANVQVRPPPILFAGLPLAEPKWVHPKAMNLTVPPKSSPAEIGRMAVSSVDSPPYVQLYWPFIRPPNWSPAWVWFTWIDPFTPQVASPV